MAPVQLVQEQTLGLGWLEVSRRILELGLDETYDGAVTKELALANRLWERHAKPSATEAGHAS